MTGTIINILAVIAGGVLGALLGARLPERMRETVLHGLGLMVFVVGVSMAITTKNILIPLFAVLAGGIVGEALDIDAALERLGRWFEARWQRGRPVDPSHRTTVAQGFITASLVFCVGPMTILGSIQDGLMGDFTLLTIKSVLDGFAAMALAASLGPGVLLSVLTLLVYQGGLSVLAGAFATALGGVTRETPWVIEMTATGGVVILSIAFILLDLRRIRAANLLPAVVVAPLLVLLLEALGIGL